MTDRPQAVQGITGICTEVDVISFLGITLSLNFLRQIYQHVFQKSAFWIDNTSFSFKNNLFIYTDEINIMRCPYFDESFFLLFMHPTSFFSTSIYVLFTLYVSVYLLVCFVLRDCHFLHAKVYMLFSFVFSLICT